MSPEPEKKEPLEEGWTIPMSPLTSRPQNTPEPGALDKLDATGSGSARFMDALKDAAEEVRVETAIAGESDHKREIRWLVINEDLGSRVLVEAALADGLKHENVTGVRDCSEAANIINKGGKNVTWRIVIHMPAHLTDLEPSTDDLSIAKVGFLRSFYGTDKTSFPMNLEPWQRSEASVIATTDSPTYEGIRYLAGSGIPVDGIKVVRFDGITEVMSAANETIWCGNTTILPLDPPNS